MFLQASKWLCLTTSFVWLQLFILFSSSYVDAHSSLSLLSLLTVIVVSICSGSAVPVKGSKIWCSMFFILFLYETEGRMMKCDFWHDTDVWSYFQVCLGELYKFPCCWSSGLYWGGSSLFKFLGFPAEHGTASVIFTAIRTMNVSSGSRINRSSISNKKVITLAQLQFYSNNWRYKLHILLMKKIRTGVLLNIDSITVFY